MVALEAGDIGEDCVGDLLRGKVAVGTEQTGQAVFSVHVAIGVFGVENPIGDEDDGVTGLSGDSQLFIRHVGKHAQWEALGADGDGLAGAAEDGLNGAGVGHLQRLVLVVP